MPENILRLLNFKVESFAKIDKSKPVVIVWPEDKKVSVLQGDQSVGKTSVLSAFSALCGLDVIKNAINKTDKDRKAELEIQKDERRYKIKITKSRFEVQLLTDDNRWATLPSAKSVLKDVLGPIGTSPMFLKEMKGEDQVNWLLSFFQLDESVVEGQKLLEQKIKEAYTSRKNAKRDHKLVESALNANDYYINRYDWEKRFADFEERMSKSGNIPEIQKEYAEYQKGENGIAILKSQKETKEEDINSVKEEIEALEKRLAEQKKILEAKEAELIAIDKRISDGEKYLEDNKSIKDRFDGIADLIREQTEIATHKANYSGMIEREKTMNAHHDLFISSENKLDALRKEKQKFIKSIVPEIDGFEVCVPGLEDESDEKENSEESVVPDQRVGLYFKSASMAELSESELWSFYLKLLHELNIRVVVIENITSLGSGAVDILNYYAETGGYVLASQMNREEKDLKVIITDKIV